MSYIDRRSFGFRATGQIWGALDCGHTTVTIKVFDNGRFVVTANMNNPAQLQEIFTNAANLIGLAGSETD